MKQAYEVGFSKLSAEQVKQLEDVLTDILGGARSSSSERIATMAAQGHSSHANNVGMRPEEGPREDGGDSPLA
jgi:hypothetical protein